MERGEVCDYSGQQSAVSSQRSAISGEPSVVIRGYQCSAHHRSFNVNHSVHRTQVSQSTAAVQYPSTGCCEVRDFDTYVKPLRQKKLGCMVIDVKKRPIKHAVRVALLHGGNLRRLMDGLTASGRGPGGGKSEIRDFADQLDHSAICPISARPGSPGKARCRHHGPLNSRRSPARFSRSSGGQAAPPCRPQSAGVDPRRGHATPPPDL